MMVLGASGKPQAWLPAALITAELLPMQLLAVTAILRIPNAYQSQHGHLGYHGRTVLQTTLDAHTQNTDIDVEHLPAGSYVMQLGASRFLFKSADFLWVRQIRKKKSGLSFYREAGLFKVSVVNWMLTTSEIPRLLIV